MKAISCTQCGAIISEFSPEDEFAKCSYCNAKYRMRDAKVQDIPRKEVIRINARIEKYSSDVQKIVDKDYGPSPKVFFGLIGFVLTVAVAGMWINGYFHGSYWFGIDQPGLRTSVSAKSKTPFSDYNNDKYGIFDFDELKYPEIFTTTLLDFSYKDITEKIFSERTINVDVKVSEDGKVIDAKAKNGHEYLRKACERAALKTTFYSPARENVTIVYSFSVQE